MRQGDASVAKSKTPEPDVKIDRRTQKDRRENTDDRRQTNAPVDTERRQAPRRKVARRRQIDPTTCERDYTADEIEFMQALDEYKRANGRMFPTCSEILEVVRSLGYERRCPEVEDDGTDQDPASDVEAENEQTTDAEISSEAIPAEDDDSDLYGSDT
jgi:hypothetical protein